MSQLDLIPLLIIGLNVLISIKGFSSEFFLRRYMLAIDGILVHKQFSRILSSTFLHVNWLHLISNMITLFVFSRPILWYLSIEAYLIIYFGSAIGGSLFAILVNRNHGSYSAVGASGAVCGLIFACIALIPQIRIWFIPAYVFGPLYLIYSIYGFRNRNDQIGHEAHLGGALTGIFILLLLSPNSFIYNGLTIALTLIPSLLFLILVIRYPNLLFQFRLVRNKGSTTKDDRYHIAKANRQAELDRILDKIHRKGINSLSKQEKKFLDQYGR